jgi:hypothetical protein
MTPPKVKPLLVAAMILIIVATPVAYAEKCKYEENRTDDFTGEKILSTKLNLFHTAVSTNSFAEAAGITEGDSNFLAIRTKKEEILAYDLYGDARENVRKRRRS